MYGKVVKKSEYEIKFGAREQLINVFICCKSLKNSINYVVFSYVLEKDINKLYYGMVHINGNKLVSMEPKAGSEEIIKDLIWKITNKKESVFKYLNLELTDDVFDKLMKKYQLEPSNHLVDLLYEALIFEKNSK